MSKSTKIIAGLSAVAMLGVAAMPMAGAFATAPNVTGDVTLQYEVSDTLTMAIIDGAGVDATTAHLYNSKTGSGALGAGDADTTYTHTLKVSTNNQYGYHISVAQATSEGTNTALLHTNGTSSIAGFSQATAVDPSNPTPANAGWGIHVTLPQTGDPATPKAGYTTAFGTNYLGLSATNVVTSAATTAAINDEETTVNYGVQTSSDQASGLYDIVLTYTAAVNTGA